jgi:hypothetical protein
MSDKLLFSISERDGLLYIAPQPGERPHNRLRDLMTQAGWRLWRLLLARRLR